jgi:hypothetical protein
MPKDHPNKAGLRLMMKRDIVSSMFPLFQKGVLIKGHLGCTIRTFLHEQLGLSNEYIDRRIQTFFVDGKAVDDIDSAYINDRSTLALSASMPGLLGATLRKGSYYAGMRSSISYTQGEKSALPHEGSVRLKLFNLLIGEMGPDILSKGVWVEGKDLQEFLGSRSKRFWSGCVEIVANGKKTEPADLAKTFWEGEVFLTVQAT